MAKKKKNKKIKADKVEKTVETVEELEQLETVELSGDEDVVEEMLADSPEEGLENTEGMELVEESDEAAPMEQTEMSPADLEPDDEDDLDEECTFDLAERKRVIEAVLFISDKSVGMSTLKAAFGEGVTVNSKHIKEAIASLEEEYQEANRGFRLLTVDGGYQVRTAEDLKPFLQNTIKARSFRLTGPSLETLAMIAYKQPCTKSQIDDIRGVDSSHLVRTLMDRGMVSFAGKSELPGKPMLYKTTTKFLDIFGLRNLKELPSLSEIEALLPNGIGDEEEEDKETLSDLTGKLSEQFEGEYSASEEELGKISDQLSSISTETDFFEQEKQRLKEKKELDKAESIREALMVGEEISTRDRNWLERYEAAALEAAGADETTEDTEEVTAVTSDIEEVTDADEILKAQDSEEDSEESEVIEVSGDLSAAEVAEDSIFESSEMVEEEMNLSESDGSVLTEEDQAEEILEEDETPEEDLPPLNENF